MGLITNWFLNAAIGSLRNKVMARGTPANPATMMKVNSDRLSAIADCKTRSGGPRRQRRAFVGSFPEHRGELLNIRDDAWISRKAEVSLAVV